MKQEHKSIIAELYNGNHLNKSDIKIAKKLLHILNTQLEEKINPYDIYDDIYKKESDKLFPKTSYYED